MKASLMVTCLCDAMYPQVGVAAVRVLERAGVAVGFPLGQTCCGQPAYNSGYQREARRAARAMLRAFSTSEFVVSPSASCAAMIRLHYPELFRGRAEQADAKALAGRTYEICEFLTEVVGVSGLPVSLRAQAVFHSSCHARRLLRADTAARTLLGMVDGLELLPLEREQDCCGFGGTFSVKMPSVSTAMVSEKAEHILATGAEMLLGVDMSCLMNISGYLEKHGARMRTRHVIQVLDEGWAT